MSGKQRANGSMNPEYAAVCGGKFRHPDFLSAMQHAISLHRKDAAELAIYHCPFCDCEHVGNVTRKGLFNRKATPGIGQASFENYENPAAFVEPLWGANR